MEAFNPDDLEKVIEQDVRDEMLDVILSWARFDTFVSKWVSLAFGTQPDAAVILMGNMDTKNKLDKLKTLYEHFGFAEGAESLNRLRKAHGEHVDVRNAIAHSSCVGRMKSDKQRIVFSSMKRVKGDLGKALVESIHTDQMRAATNFALKACANIEKIIAAIDEPLAEPFFITSRTPAVLSAQPSLVAA
jgi:hypothetical protein